MVKDMMLFCENGSLSECRWSAAEVVSRLSTCHYFGFFETVLCLNSKPVLLNEHLARLLRSCNEFSISVPDADELRRAVAAFCSSDVERKISVLKLTVLKAGGSSSLIHLSLGNYRYMKQELKEGFKLAVAGVRRDGEPLLARHKSTHRLELELLRSNAVSRGFHDALLVDREGFVLETTRANVFVFRNGKWLTPPKSLGFLAGTVRNFLLSGGLKGFEFLESRMRMEDVLQGEEMVVTNSLIGAAPVVFLENGKKFKVKRALELSERLWSIFQNL